MQELVNDIPTSQRSKYTRRIQSIKSERDMLSRALVFITFAQLTPDPFNESFNLEVNRKPTSTRQNIKFNSTS